MNLALLDPFVLAQDCPEVLVGNLSSGHAACIRFNHQGDLLASGRYDGKIAIFDIETYGVARKLQGHRRQIQSLSWSANNRYLLSSSQDWKCVLWDLQDGSQLRVVRFEAPVFIADLHPTNHFIFVAALFEDRPVLVDATCEIAEKHILPSAPRRTAVDGESAREKQAAQDAKQTTTVTVYNATGDYILAGTNKGWLNVIHAASCQTVYSTRLTNNIIIYIRLSLSGRNVVVNASDRIIRTIQLPNLSSPTIDFDNLQLEVEFKFQDVVNRLSWNHVTFSSTGEYVIASTYMNHDIYVWERSRGSLVRILETPSEELSVVEWHPHRPFIAAVGVDSGRIYIWSIVTPQRWSALAPDFAEVEENVEYVEREDEFDIRPQEEITKRRLDLEDESVDVLTVEPAREILDSGNFRMPVLLDIENSDSEDEVVAIGTGQYRRKSPNRGQDLGKEGENSRGNDEQLATRSKPSAGAAKAVVGLKRRKPD